MQLIVNGGPHEYRGAPDLAALVAEFTGGAARVAVLLNDVVVPAARRAETAVRDGDRIEILTFAGGG